eukprot:1520149-Rhodomonas_salina.7
MEAGGVAQGSCTCAALGAVVCVLLALLGRCYHRLHRSLLCVLAAELPRPAPLSLREPDVGAKGSACRASEKRAAGEESEKRAEREGGGERERERESTKREREKESAKRERERERGGEETLVM